MATYYWTGLGATNNWNNTSNWSTASAGTTAVSAVPTTTEDLIWDGAGVSGSKNSTMNANYTVKSYTVTSGYTGTITHGNNLTVNGDVTLGSNYIISGSSQMVISGSSNITSNGKVWPNAMTFNGTNGIKTLIGNLEIGGSLTSGNTGQVINPTTNEKLTVGGLAGVSSMTVNLPMILKSGTWSSTGMSFLGGLQISGSVTITTPTIVSGSVTYVTGNVTTTGGTLSTGGNVIFDTDGVTWNNITLANGATCTYTLNSPLTASGILNLGNNAPFFTGSNGFRVGTVQDAAIGNFSLTLQSGIEYIISDSLISNTGRSGAIRTITSNHATNKAILTLLSGASCNTNAVFTRVDASRGRPIRTFNAAVTDCVNVMSFTDIQTVASSFISDQ